MRLKAPSQPEMASRTSTEEVADVRNPVVTMKTMAIRLTDETNAQLTLIARLEGTSIAELLRQAIEQLLTDKMKHGDLAKKAEAALAEIDQEAEARRQAIQAMLTPQATLTELTAPKNPRPRGRRSGSSGTSR
ncbi:MAG: ribbon-helix-helix protein, CopG family [Acidimicrobiales bacterium]